MPAFAQENALLMTWETSTWHFRSAINNHITFILAGGNKTVVGFSYIRSNNTLLQEGLICLSSLYTNESWIEFTFSIAIQHREIVLTKSSNSQQKIRMPQIPTARWNRLPLKFNWTVSVPMHIDLCVRTPQTLSILWTGTGPSALSYSDRWYSRLRWARVP